MWKATHAPLIISQKGQNAFCAVMGGKGALPDAKAVQTKTRALHA